MYVRTSLDSDSDISQLLCDPVFQIDLLKIVESMATAFSDSKQLLGTIEHSCKQLVTAHSKLIGIARIPDELLCDIFDYLEPADLVVVGAVCKRLRTLSKKLVSVWCNINNRMHTSVIQRCIERSQGQGLTIIIMPSDSLQIILFLTSILPSCNRWKTLLINLQWEIPEPNDLHDLNHFAYKTMCSMLRSLDLPMLEAFIMELPFLLSEMDGTNLAEGDDYNIGFLSTWTSPNLRRVTLVNVTPSSMALQGCTLESLDYQICGSRNNKSEILFNVYPHLEFLGNPIVSSLKYICLNITDICVLPSSLDFAGLPQIIIPNVEVFVFVFRSGRTFRDEPDYLGSYMEFQVENVPVILQRLRMPKLVKYQLGTSIFSSCTVSNEPTRITNPVPLEVTKGWFPDCQQHPSLQTTLIFFWAQQSWIADLAEPEKSMVWHFGISTVCNTETYELDTYSNVLFVDDGFRNAQMPTRLKTLILRECVNMEQDGLLSMLSLLKEMGAFETLEKLEIIRCPHWPSEDVKALIPSTCVLIIDSTII